MHLVLSGRDFTKARLDYTKFFPNRQLPTTNVQVNKEAFITSAHKTALEVFVEVVAEDLISGERNVGSALFHSGRQKRKPATLMAKSEEVFTP